MSYLSSKVFAVNQVVKRIDEAISAYPEALKSKNGIYSYWGFKNFGDLITPFLLKELGYTPIHAPRVSYAQVTFVGSILDSINPRFNGIIIGSGFLNDRRPKNLPNAKVLGVRGKYSKQLLGIKNDIQLGDGGLILSKYIKDRPEKKFQLGIVPHYSNASDPRVLKWKENFKNHVLFIDVLQSPEIVFKQVASCEYIASSSLHGLVLADSLNIPNSWLMLSNLSGNGTFKFEDYYSAFGLTRNPLIPTGREKVSELIKNTYPVPNNVNEIIEGVNEQFIQLTNFFPQKNKK